MKAMVLHAPRMSLKPEDRPVPRPGSGQLLLRVRACGVCRTDLHIVDGELPDPKLPLVPGHEIIGEVVGGGSDTGRFRTGQRVGVPWLGWSCGRCRFCRTRRENLCDEARFTGYQLDGGYAEYTMADESYCFSIPDEFPDDGAAPLMCAGLIGFRSLRAAGDAERLGIYGFGAAAHLITQVALFENRRVYAFTRPGDEAGQQFARSLGVDWAGGSDETPPDKLDAAIVFAPVGALVPAALKVVDKGGTVVCGGIHMSDIPGFPYRWLWEERCIRSVANLTRRDAEDFLELAARVPVRSKVRTFGLAEANEALEELRGGRLEGAAVLIP